MNKLSAFYEKLLQLCGIEVGDHGRLYFPFVPENIYLTYDDRNIVFPEKQYLQSKENPTDKTIVFHPLSESAIRQVSEVQDILRRTGILHLNIVGREILNKAIEVNRNITADSSYKPSHKLSKLFAEIGEIDEKFMKFWVKLNDKMTSDSKSRLFDIYLKQQGEVKGKRYDRICTISSPLYDAVLHQKDNKIFGVQAERKKDINTLKSILDTLYPRLEEGGYIVGSSESTAPFLNAFIDGLVEIENRFNDVLVIYGKEANKMENVYCKGLDVKDGVDIAKIRNMVPADKPYNVGLSKDQNVDDIGDPNKLRRRKADVVTKDDRGLAQDDHPSRTVPTALAVVVAKPVTAEAKQESKQVAVASLPAWMNDIPDENRNSRRDDGPRGRQRNSREERYNERNDRTSRGRDDYRDDRGYRDDRYGYRGRADERDYRGRDDRYGSRGRDDYRDNRGYHDDRNSGRNDYRDNGRGDRDSIDVLPSWMR